MPADTDTGLVIYYGAGGAIQDYGAGLDYNALEIAGPGVFAVAADLTVVADITLSGGTLDGSGLMIVLGGGFDGSAGGTFAHGNGSVRLIDAAQTTRILGSNDFFTLTCAVDNKVIKTAVQERLFDLKSPAELPDLDLLSCPIC